MSRRRKIRNVSGIESLDLGGLLLSTAILIIAILAITVLGARP